MLITDTYKNIQQNMHATGDYGVVAGMKYGPLVTQLIDKLEIDAVLDYGCGSKLSLRDSMSPKRNITYQAYDPCVPEYAAPPEPSEMVVCVDVMEHIEPECLDDVLDHLVELVQVVLFVSVNTGAALKTLEDGRNAHLIQQPMEWWLPKFWERFVIQRFQITGPKEFYLFAHNMALDIEDGQKTLLPRPIVNE